MTSLDEMLIEIEARAKFVDSKYFSVEERWATNEENARLSPEISRLIAAVRELVNQRDDFICDPTLDKPIGQIIDEANSEISKLLGGEG